MRPAVKLRRLAARWCSEVLAEQGQALLHPTGGGQTQPSRSTQSRSRPADLSLIRSETRRKLMGSRAARSLLGPLVDGYRDLEPAKQTLSRPGTAKGQTWARSQWEEMDLGGGGGGAKAAEIFKRYDGDNTGNIDEKEMMQALQELGVLDPKVTTPDCLPACLKPDAALLQSKVQHD